MIRKIKFVVKTIDGIPISGATVTVSSVMGLGKVSGTTGVDGSITIEKRIGFKRYSVVGQGYKTAMGFCRKVYKPEELTVTLVPRREIVVTEEAVSKEVVTPTIVPPVTEVAPVTVAPITIVPTPITPIPPAPTSTTVTVGQVKAGKYAPVTGVILPVQPLQRAM